MQVGGKQLSAAFRKLADVQLRVSLSTIHLSEQVNSGE